MVGEFLNTDERQKSTEISSHDSNSKLSYKNQKSSSNSSNNHVIDRTYS